MVSRPAAYNAFEFVVVSALRAAQLMKGCVPRMDGAHKTTMMAQMEVAAGKVARVDAAAVAAPAPAAADAPVTLS